MLLPLRSGKRVGGADERVSRRLLLRRSGADRPLLAANPGAQRDRVLASKVHRQLRQPDLTGDLAILVADPRHVVGLGDHVVQRAGADQEVDGRRLAFLVDRHQTLREHVELLRVLPLEVVELIRLEAEQLVELGQPLPVQREVGLQGRQVQRYVSDPRFE